MLCVAASLVVRVMFVECGDVVVPWQYVAVVGPFRAHEFMDAKQPPLSVPSWGHWVSLCSSTLSPKRKAAVVGVVRRTLASRDLVESPAPVAVSSVAVVRACYVPLPESACPHFPCASFPWEACMVEATTQIGRHRDAGLRSLQRACLGGAPV